MIINGFSGGGNGGYSGTATLLNTYTGSVTTTRNSGISLGDGGGSIYCSNTTWTKMWYFTNTITVSDFNWDNYNNIGCKAIKIDFAITSLNITGKLGLFTNKSGTTAAQTINMVIYLAPTFTIKYCSLADYYYNISNLNYSWYQTTTMGNANYFYGGSSGTRTGSVSSVPSSGSTVTQFAYPTLTWSGPSNPNYLSAYFEQLIRRENGSTFWRPVAPSGDVLKYSTFMSGNVNLDVSCYAACASGGSGNMKWEFYDSSDTNIWPAMTLGWTMYVYGIN